MCLRYFRQLLVLLKLCNYNCVAIYSPACHSPPWWPMEELVNHAEHISCINLSNVLRHSFNCCLYSQPHRIVVIFTANKTRLIAWLYAKSRFFVQIKSSREMSIIWFLWIQSCSQSCPRFRPRQSIYVVDRFYTTAVHLNANNLLQSILCQMCLFLTGRIFRSLEIKQPRQDSKTALFQLCNCACQI